MSYASLPLATWQATGSFGELPEFDRYGRRKHPEAGTSRKISAIMLVSIQETSKYTA